MSNLAVFNKTINDTRTQEYLNDVLKESKQSFVTSLVSVVGNNTLLQACEPLTIIYAAMKAATLKLPIDPNIGAAYVIPYKNKGKDEAQFQLGTKGFVQLAMRSGQFLSINADVVYEGEISKINKKSGDVEFDGEKKSDKVVGYFAYFKLTNGFEKTLYMTKEEITAHAQRFSKAYGYGPWKTDFDAMAVKTVLKRLLSKFAPLSVEMQNAVNADQAVFRSQDLKPEYVDNAATEAQEEKDEQVSRLKEKAEAIKARARKAAKPVEEVVEVEEPVEEPAEDADTETGELYDDMPEE